MIFQFQIGLEVVKAVMSDTGVYECHLTNEVGKETGVCNVTVHKIFKPPHFSRQLNNVKQLLDCDARFVCEVGCNPKPTIVWKCNGKVIEDGGRYKIKNNGNTRMLIVKKLKATDAGTYECCASNKEGSGSTQGTLEIVEYVEKGRSDAPEFLKKIGDEMVFRGMAARFTALVTGFPEPEYEWLFNGKPLYPTDR